MRVPASGSNITIAWSPAAVSLMNTTLKSSKSSPGMPARITKSLLLPARPIMATALFCVLNVATMISATCSGVMEGSIGIRPRLNPPSGVSTSNWKM